MQNSQQITCPNCKHSFDLSDFYIHSIEEEVKKSYELQLIKLNEEKELQFIQLQHQNEEVSQKLRKESEDRLKLELDNYKKQHQEEISKAQREAQEQAKIQNENIIKNLKDREDSYKIQIEEFQNTNKKLNEKELELMKLKSEFDNIKTQTEIESQKQLQIEKERIKEEISKQEHDKSILDISSRDKKINDLSKLVDELQRKTNQGSMQLQGEILELEIENYLSNQFRFDKVEPVGKGIKGADVALKVYENGRYCGTILIETKRTKAFSKEWLDKLDRDLSESNSQIGILVSETLPDPNTKISNQKGIWICDYSNFKYLVNLLREQLIKVNSVVISQSNAADKASIIYKYFTSQQFQSNFKTIVNSFEKLENEIQKEKKVMEKIWKQRELLLKDVISNTLNIHSTLSHIANEDMTKIEAFEYEYEPEQLNAPTTTGLFLEEENED